MLGDVRFEAFMNVIYTGRIPQYIGKDIKLSPGETFLCSLN